MGDSVPPPGPADPMPTSEGGMVPDDAYLGTIDRLEPNIAAIDPDAALASIAISLKRIADALEAANGQTSDGNELAPAGGGGPMMADLDRGEVERLLVAKLAADSTLRAGDLIIANTGMVEGRTVYQSFYVDSIEGGIPKLVEAE